MNIINLAVQAALTTLKATPEEESDAYRLEPGAAQIPMMPENDFVNTLAKLRRLIYIFRNRRQWKDALQGQCKAAGIKPLQMSLDMPAPWSSTYHMLDIAIKLQIPIIAVCESQKLDLSMRDIALLVTDWATLYSLLQLRPTEKMQAAIYVIQDITLMSLILYEMQVVYQQERIEQEYNGKCAFDSMRAESRRSILQVICKSLIYGGMYHYCELFSDKPDEVERREERW
jgi:hypothetical protein